MILKSVYSGSRTIEIDGDASTQSFGVEVYDGDDDSVYVSGMTRSEMIELHEIIGELLGETQ